MGKVGRLRAAGGVSVIALTLMGGASDADAAPPEKGRAEAQGAIARPANAGDAARARARQGDCAGALDAYDQAIRTTIDPDLRRDRGLCHEQLGHPFPAIDDYRYYLTARPHAPDAEAIRTRLTRLEEQAGVVAPGAADKGDKGESAEASASMSVSFNGSTTSATVPGRNLDTIESDEKLDIQADESPLRRGKGFEIGLAIAGMRYTKADLGWSELVGMDLRYSVSRVSTLLLEFGYAHVNSTGTPSALGGALIAAGYEARIALNPRVTDALLVGATLGYEHLSQPSTGSVFAAFFPQGRFGYRRVVGPTLGLEAALDAGIAILHLTGAPAGASANTTSPIFGLHVGVVLGF
jgi:hypothetical protein